MEQLNLDIKNSENIEKVADAVAEVLQSGGVIIYPTDTIYGIGANAFNEEAIEKVMNIKNRDSEKPLSVFVKDIKSARRIACIDSKVEKMLENIWPGPITVILRKKDIVPYLLTGNGETIAVRIPQNKFILHLLEKVEFPIIATSANISGENNLFDAEEIMKKFGNKKNRIDLFVNIGNIQKTQASTIVDLTTTIPRIVRMGIVGKEEMDNFFKKFI